MSERSSLWIDTVQRGDMLREVRATGTLVPRTSRWLAAATAAQVEQILVWPGAVVQPDTVLMKLSNPEVEDAPAQCAGPGGRGAGRGGGQARRTAVATAG